MNNINDLGDIITHKLKDNFELFELKDILFSYNGSDWNKYINFDKLKYTRNIVYKNNNIEIIIICWYKWQSSKIHDHPNNGCILKVLHGNLEENIYNNTSGNLVKIKTNILNNNNVSYMKGNTHLHNICNNSNEYAVSIHVYSPPNYAPNIYENITK